MIFKMTKEKKISILFLLILAVIVIFSIIYNEKYNDIQKSNNTEIGKAIESSSPKEDFLDRYEKIDNSCIFKNKQDGHLLFLTRQKGGLLVIEPYDERWNEIWNLYKEYKIPFCPPHERKQEQ